MLSSDHEGCVITYGCEHFLNTVTNLNPSSRELMIPSQDDIGTIRQRCWKGLEGSASHDNGMPQGMLPEPGKVFGDMPGQLSRKADGVIGIQGGENDQFQNLPTRKKVSICGIPAL